MIRFYKYSGAGNTFTVIDGRKLELQRFKRPEVIHALCLQYETDALMILEDPVLGTDFKMSYFNSDGSGGMMCGNGGRCMVAFADLLGVKPFHTKDYVFEAPDGIHKAQILSHLGESKLIRLSMNDVARVSTVSLDSGIHGYCLDTGAPHFVIFVEDAGSVDVNVTGRALRFDPRFAPVGTNVDFVSVLTDGRLYVRTYERGVEAETGSCGTGMTASAIAAFQRREDTCSYDEAVRTELVSNQDVLSVEFIPRMDGAFTDVFLTGPTICLGDLVE